MTLRSVRSAPTYIERIARLEEARDTADKQMKEVVQKVSDMHDVLMHVTGIKWFLKVIGTLIGVTAGTVTATIALIHFITGH